ncbi:MAG: acyltransferase [Victivallaceae bacterium]|jgi:peptidoglycan/LPS O-acetylase OafA/YrhL
MSTKHLTYLDSLRGLAALTVVFAHYTQLFHSSPFTHAGRLAVCLFFILSGFVLSQRFLGVEGMKWPLIEAVIKRPFRLLGVVWITVILGLSVNSFTQGIPVSQYGKTWIQFVIDFFVSPFSTGELYNGVLWTIHWELWGSMLVFALLLFCNTFPKYLRLLIFSMIMILNIHNFYCAFMIGVIVADLHRNFYWNKLVKYRNFLSALMTFICIGTYFMYCSTSFDSRITIYIKDGLRMVGAIEIFLLVMLNTSFSQSVLKWRPFNLLGNISYSFYAIHFLIMITIAETIDSVLKQYLQYDIAFWTMVLITLPIIIFIAWIIDKYIDKPSIRLAARIAKLTTGIIRQEVAKRGTKIKTKYCRPDIRDANTGNTPLSDCLVLVERTQNRDKANPD